MMGRDGYVRYLHLLPTFRMGRNAGFRVLVY